MSEYSDVELVCSDCNQTFVFSAEEQERYASRNFSEPKRCPECRQNRRTQHRQAPRRFGGGGGGGGGGYGGGGGGYGGGGYGGGGGGGYGRGAPRRREQAPRKMTQITCTSCGKVAQVPFEPAPDRPVYCQDCYRSQRGTH